MDDADAQEIRREIGLFKSDICTRQRELNAAIQAGDHESAEELRGDVAYLQQGLRRANDHLRRTLVAAENVRANALALAQQKLTLAAREETLKNLHAIQADVNKRTGM